MPILDVQRVVKRFGPVTAVDGVSFRVGPGEVVGLLGPNGAGNGLAAAAALDLLYLAARSGSSPGCWSRPGATAAWAGSPSDQV